MKNTFFPVRSTGWELFALGNPRALTPWVKTPGQRHLAQDQKGERNAAAAPPAGRLCRCWPLIQRKTALVIPVDCTVPGGTRMAIVEQTSTGDTVVGDGRQSWIRTNWGLLLAVTVLAAILLAADTGGIAGRRPSHARHSRFRRHHLDDGGDRLRRFGDRYRRLMAFLLGLAPSVANPKVLMGTSAALGLPSAALPTPRWCWWPRRFFLRRP